MYYPCSENKDADQLRGYREADLRLCFRPCKLLVFSRTGSFVNSTPGLHLASVVDIKLLLCVAYQRKRTIVQVGKIRKRRNQKKIPTPKTEVGKY